MVHASVVSNSYPTTTTTTGGSHVKNNYMYLSTNPPGSDLSCKVMPHLQWYMHIPCETWVLILTLYLLNSALYFFAIFLKELHYLLDQNPCLINLSVSNLCLFTKASNFYFSQILFINRRRTCAERVTVVVLCVCMSVTHTLFWQYVRLKV